MEVSLYKMQASWLQSEKAVDMFQSLNPEVTATREVWRPLTAVMQAELLTAVVASATMHLKRALVHVEVTEQLAVLVKHFPTGATSVTLSPRQLQNVVWQALTAAQPVKFPKPPPDRVLASHLLMEPAADTVTARHRATTQRKRRDIAVKSESVVSARSRPSKALNRQ
jgi:hypothetical protein